MGGNIDFSCRQAACCKNIRKDFLTADVGRFTRMNADECGIVGCVRKSKPVIASNASPATHLQA